MEEGQPRLEPNGDAPKALDPEIEEAIRVGARAGARYGYLRARLSQEDSAASQDAPEAKPREARPEIEQDSADRADTA